MRDQANSAAARCDVAIIGGGAAGLAAALLLGRARRSVVVVDGGEPRNAVAVHMHGYLGHEGVPPGDFLAIGREEVRRYGVEVWERCRAEVSPLDGGGFLVEASDGGVVHARRILIATGLIDELPAIDGLPEQWGRGVIHCPYCHGWEVRDQPLVVICTSPIGAHQAGLFRQWSDEVTMVVHEGEHPDPETTARLASRGVAVIDGPVVAVVSDEHDAVTGVRLADGTALPARAVVVGPRFTARTAGVSGLGIVTVPDPTGLGEVIAVDPMGLTAVPGVYAAGNATDARGQVLQAAAAGGMVGAAINADLIVEDTDAAMRHRPEHRDGAAPIEWDERYGDAPVWSGLPNDVLVAEMSDDAPGRALDVGCGEGADALWLASRGWETTGLDVSQVALARAAGAAGAAGVHVEWVLGDLAANPTPAVTFDLVSLHYPALRHTPGDEAIRALLAAVAPGGTLLVVGHAPLDAEFARSHGVELADFIQPGDVAARLDGSWQVDVDETRPRVRPAPRASITHDVVLRATRRR